jgi:hypothetical protein
MTLLKGKITGVSEVLRNNMVIPVRGGGQATPLHRIPVTPHPQSNNRRTNQIDMGSHHRGQQNTRNDFFNVKKTMQVIRNPGNYPSRAAYKYSCAYPQNSPKWCRAKLRILS